MDLKAFSKRIVAVFHKPSVQGTLWMITARGFRIVIQAGYFVIIARALGAEQYGAFVGVVALAGLLTPFCGLGSEHILIKHVSRDRLLFREYWGNALFLAIASSLVLIPLAMLAARVFLPASISPWLVALICISDLLFLRIIDTASKALLSVDLVNKTARLQISLTLKNLLAALALITFFETPNVVIWSLLYCGSTVITGVTTFFWVSRLVARPKLALKRIPPELVEGFYFSIGLSAQSINSNVDKTMLTRLSTLQATGVYAAAYRIIDVALTPIFSALGVFYAKFFRYGESGITGSLSLAKRLVPIAGLYGLVASLSLFLLAPLLPLLLGEEYRESVEALRWLSPLLILQSLQFFAADTLSGAGYQGARSGLQVTAALLNFLINLWVIPLYSWRGAAGSSILSEGFLMLGMFAVVYVLYTRHMAKARRELQETQEL
ncbi:oligosaccharide flippase family protein [Leptolyngbya sp. AN02str]|uniref:oligosaccharide flippase family protein n=1 Tax=Leptolyngbya sp. AN02str TaxID=3423363 RepID=UPI003D311F11